VACYPDELRWTSAYLLHDSVRPSNLTVLSDTVVDRVLLERTGEQVTAKGVVVRVGEGAAQKECVVRLDERGEIALTGGAFGTVSVLQRSGVG
jgi:choline dehydrogenase-like flavoprotein